jgi:hypothetical protein
MTTNRTNRAEEFDRALSAAPGAKVDPTMAALLAVTGALAALPQKSAPAFRDALRTRLMAEAATLAPQVAASVPAAAPATPSVPAPRSIPKLLQHPALQVATGGLAAAIAVTGVGVGASRSLPGDALYGLKRAVEGLQVGASGGAVGEAGALVEHAQTRLDEVRALAARGDLTGATLARVESALRALESELSSAVDRLLVAARNGSRFAYDRLSATIADLTAQLTALLGDLPPLAAALASQSLGTLNAAAAQLAAMPVPPLPTGTPVTPSPTSVTPSPTGTGVVPTGPVVTTPPVTRPPTTKPPVSPPLTTPPVTIPPLSTPPTTLPVTLPPVLP